MADVMVRGFKRYQEAFSALRDHEYREHLVGIGCPPDRIAAEIEKLRQRVSAGAIIDDDLLISNLDDIFRTVPAIKKLIGRNGWHLDHICDALRRLAKAGWIDKREQPTGAPRPRNLRLPKQIGAVMHIEFYRRLP